MVATLKNVSTTTTLTNINPTVSATFLDFRKQLPGYRWAGSRRELHDQYYIFSDRGGLRVCGN